MGLRQGETVHQNSSPTGGWLLAGAAIGCAVAAELAGDAGRSWLRYDRDGIANGEYWRWISGHFVHLGWSHLALNVLGLLLIWFLVSARFGAREWLGITLVTIAGIDLGFWLLEPQLQWYVGLSGLLHGILAAGIVAGLRLRRQDAALLGILVVAKLAFEQLVGPVPGSEASTGGAVIVAAHLYGAFAGALCGAVLPVRVWPEASL